MGAILAEFVDHKLCQSAKCKWRRKRPNMSLDDTGCGTVVGRQFVIALVSSTAACRTDER